jgi:hypothetical protein
MVTMTRTDDKATAKAEAAKAPRTARAPVALHERMKNQLSTAVLRSKIGTDELEVLESHIAKLKGLLAE